MSDVQTERAESVEDAPDDPGLERLLVHLKEERSFDFTGYKRASLGRRVERRMESVAAASFDDYLDHLIVHPDEFAALFDTVLINVTAFFRDPDSWDYLRTELLPPLLAQREGQPIRVWCAGCASGEEAYTIAMVLAELIGVDAVRERVKIYATDVDEDALAHARAAVYTERDLEAVPEALRSTYFERVGARYVVRKELRRAVIFGRNDLVQDAPISHVDLLTCRNTLMYFTAEAQARIIGRLHFALRPDGVLFLGKAEMLLSHSAHFRAIEVKRRFFRTQPTDPRESRVLARVTGPAGAARPAEDPAPARLRQAALMTSGAAQLVLDAEGRLAFVNNRAMHLFGLGQRDLGRPIQDLEMSYRPVELRTHIDEAVAERRTVLLRDVELLRGVSDPVYLDIQFVPLQGDDGTLLGLNTIFTDVTAQRALQHDLELANRQLETAYEELQSVNEELETTNEELQSTVEELETTNEELQSTNEELETMNQELQSINDEFQSINDVLQERQQEVDQLNLFLTSVLASMGSGVAVVDPELRVLAWNSRAADLWGVRSDEALGVHLANLDIGLPVEQLLAPIRAQLAADGSTAPHVVVLDAIDRRGRAVEVEVTLTAILDGDDRVSAAMLAMEATAGP